MTRKPKKTCANGSTTRLLNSYEIPPFQHWSHEIRILVYKMQQLQSSIDHGKITVDTKLSGPLNNNDTKVSKILFYTTNSTKI